MRFPVSILRRPGIRYPAGDDFFSPSESYPEYAHGAPASAPNEVYRAVRDCLAQAGLDAARFGRPDWNPLGELVAPGSRVFVLCNFVYHMRVGETQEEFFSKCTHGSVVRALVDYLLIAVGPEGLVRFGNAPVQSCEWERVQQETGAARVSEFYAARGLPVEACDLRMTVSERDLMGRVLRSEERDAARHTVTVDLGADSMLAGLHGEDSLLRVSEYNPDRTSSFHDGGRHQYVLHRHVLESDVVFSAPKLKTHEKVGITCGLKGSVGAIGHKDCLAHHRFGPPSRGGDEYPRDSTGILRLQSRFHDYVYRIPSSSPVGNVLRVVDRAFRRVQSRTVRIMPGSWWGNDTAWRMTLDIARVIAHATPDGRLHERPVRRHHLLLDGIVGGEGNGPLRSEPVGSGALIFSEDVPTGDYAAARVMGLDPERIPLVREAFARFRFPLTGERRGQARVVLNGRETELGQVGPEHPFKPPYGWTGHVEMSGQPAAAPAPAVAGEEDA